MSNEGSSGAGEGPASEIRGASSVRHDTLAFVPDKGNWGRIKEYLSLPTTLFESPETYQHLIDMIREMMEKEVGHKKSGRGTMNFKNKNAEAQIVSYVADRMKTGQPIEVTLSIESKRLLEMSAEEIRREVTEGLALMQEHTISQIMAAKKDLVIR